MPRMHGRMTTRACTFELTSHKNDTICQRVVQFLRELPKGPRAESLEHECVRSAARAATCSSRTCSEIAPLNAQAGMRPVRDGD